MPQKMSLLALCRDDDNKVILCLSCFVMLVNVKSPVSFFFLVVILINESNVIFFSICNAPSRKFRNKKTGRQFFSRIRRRVLAFPGIFLSLQINIRTNLMPTHVSKF